jgi:hypothetical protein
MTDRKEIEEIVKRSDYHESLVLPLILEVLLDIRELLEKDE